MDNYLNITLLPDPEFTTTVLMSALFSKLHRGLVTVATGRIGISFPAVDKASCGLGERLRLHGSSEALSQLMALPWLSGMSDHVRLGSIRTVPDGVQHRVVRRVQAKSNPERLRRRMMRRKGVSAQEALAAIPGNAAERLDLPYVTLSSHSTGQRLRLFIEHGPLLDTPIAGPFSSYGLSHRAPAATVPWF